MPLPDYLYLPGRQILRHPYIGEGGRMFSFLLNANQEALQELLDQSVNILARPKGFQYRSILPRVMLAFFDFPMLRSVNPPDCNMGYIRERDASFWIPMIAEPLVRGDKLPVSRFAWYPPFMFVDNAWACASGREIFGYDKAMSVFDIPENAEDQGVFRLSTLVIEKFDPDTPARVQTLLELRRDDGGPLGTLAALGKGIQEVAVDLWTLFTGPEGRLTLHNLGVANEILEILKSGKQTTVLIKQFPSSENANVACYQELIELEGSATNVRDAGALTGSYRLNIYDFESHPIAQKLGLIGSDIEVGTAFHLGMDMRIDLGIRA